MTLPRPLAWLLDSRWVNPPLAVLALLGLVTLLVRADAPPLLRAAPVAALLLFGSGASLVVALFPRSHPLDRLEMLALSGGMSLAIGGMLGFGLARSPRALTLDGILTGLLVVNLVCYVVTVLRGHGDRPSAGRLLVETQAWAREGRRLWVAQGERARAVSTALLLMTLVGAGALVWSLQRNAPDPPITEFFLLGEVGLLGDFPEIWPTDQPLTLRYGLVNRTAGESRYEIRVTSEGRELARVETPTLRPGKRFGGAIPLDPAPTSATGEVERLNFELYRDGRPEQTLHLWLTVGRVE